MKKKRNQEHLNKTLFTMCSKRECMHLHAHLFRIYQYTLKTLNHTRFRHSIRTCSTQLNNSSSCCCYLYSTFCLFAMWCSACCMPSFSNTLNCIYGAHVIYSMMIYRYKILCIYAAGTLSFSHSHPLVCKCSHMCAVCVCVFWNWDFDFDFRTIYQIVSK